MRNFLVSLVTLCVLVGLSACQKDERKQGDIYLPEGDAAKGQMHFVSLGCTGCHTVVDADLPEPAQPGPVRVILGSRTSANISYGQLVTSIVNPSHRLSPRYREEEVSRDGESLMISYNDVLTVTQLTDLVAFLQSSYKTERVGYKYPVYDYPPDEDAESAEPN